MPKSANATRCMQLASVAVEEGHEVNVFFVDDGVFFARKGMMENIVAPTGDTMEEHAEKLVMAKIPFYA